MVGRYPTLIKELNAESPQFRRLNDFKSRRQVGFLVAEERRARWVKADRGRNMPPRGHRMPQLADARPSTPRAGMR